MIIANLTGITMQLWEATLSHAPAMEPRLLAYFPCLVEIMERSFDHLQVGFIVVSIILFMYLMLNAIGVPGLVVLSIALLFCI